MVAHPPKNYACATQIYATVPDPDLNPNASRDAVLNSNDVAATKQQQKLDLRCIIFRYNSTVCISISAVSFHGI
jgi:hypothetical protein